MAVHQEGRVFGLYRDFPSLRLGVDSLKALQFSNNDIAVLFPESAVSKTFSEEEDGAEAAAADPAAFIGGALGWLTYVRPEGDGVIAGALVALGVSPGQADFYEEHLRSGSLLVSIRSSSPSQFENAAGALAATGADLVVAGRAVSGSPARTPAVCSETFAADRFIKAVFSV